MQPQQTPMITLNRKSLNLVALGSVVYASRSGRPKQITRFCAVALPQSSDSSIYSPSGQKVVCGFISQRNEIVALRLL